MTGNNIAATTTGKPVRGHSRRLDPSDSAGLIAVAGESMFANYSQAPLVVDKGHGCYLVTVEGTRYLDFTAGNAVSCLGYSHPAVTAAIASQATRILHSSNLVHNRQAILLAEQLCARTPFDRAFFCTSGSEANEAMLKLARRYHHERGQPRTHIISTTTGFHGRTYGALSVTGAARHKTGTGPHLPDVTHIPFNSINAAASVIGPHTAAMIVETVQAEAGVLVADHAYLRGLRELCDRHGALLLFDEVQTGVCRTGPLLSSRVIPDACSLAKGLAAGLPIGAVLARENLASAWPVGSHASTFGGNPVTAAAAAAVLQTLDAENIPEHVQRMGAILAAGLDALVADPNVPAVATRGVGLLRGLELDDTVDADAVLTQLREHGLLLSVVAQRVLRFTPPLVITDAELASGLATLGAVLRQRGPRTRALASTSKG
ncbi:acetylornithine transaminase [Nocardia puris]|uniref:aspartate aminotransferase family protein n=1 Tax=Nocardia puris TaxID=208602 RepID=UPI0018930CD3|nr:acetylornithine transaminase [Nocardia puris]MBF6370354.1 acetylornithine transaminase [Nocardia puris]